MTEPVDSDDWITRTLRSMHEEPGYDPAAARAEYDCLVRRMETDPAYRAHIEQLAAEFDEDCRSLGIRADDA